jgi:hypothetical protein
MALVVGWWQLPSVDRDDCLVWVYLHKRSAQQLRVVA